MHLSETVQVMEALSANEANLKLREGWSLISVVVITHPMVSFTPATYWENRTRNPTMRQPID